MSRIAKKPIILPKGVEVKIGATQIDIKGPKGSNILALHREVVVKQTTHEFKSQGKEAVTHPVLLCEAANKVQEKMPIMVGTTRALLNNMITGVSQGFERQLELVGVGYRAQVQGQKLNLSLGFSHPVVYDLPKGVVAETPSNTLIILKGVDKQQLGQVASEIRKFRPPEPYKGKGIKYAGEHIVRKETKKK